LNCFKKRRPPDNAAGWAGSVRQVAKAASLPRVIRNLWKLLTKRQKVVLVSVSVMNTAAAVSVVLPSVIIGQMVSSLTVNASAPIWGRIGLLAGLLMLFVALRVYIHIALHWVLPRVEAALRSVQINHGLKTPISTNVDENQSTGELSSLMSKGAKAGADTVKVVFNDLMPAVLQAAVAVIAAFLNQWLIGLLLLASGIASTLITQLQLRSQGGIRVAIERAKSALDGVTIELLGGKSVIRTLNAAESEARRVADRAMELSAVEVRHHKMMGLFDAAKTFSENIFTIVVLIVAAGFVAGGANPGLVLTLYLLFMQFVTPLRDIHRIRDELNESGTQLGIVFEDLNTPVDPIFTRPDATPSPHGVEVMVDHVSAGYDSQKSVVKDVSLAISAGAFVGICGPRGCGKSTLIKAVVGIHSPSRGHIMIEGLDTTAMSIHQYAETVAYISQDSYVPSGTIRDNLLLGQPHALPDEQLIAALGQVGLLNEITKKGGLDTRVGEDGQGLSGGQKQCLVLARILLRPAKLIVLDEATSALDNITEELIMHTLEATGKTIIAIAHRLSTLRNADQIIVMKEGRICERGTYISLDHQEGFFHSLLHAGEDANGVQ